MTVSKLLFVGPSTGRATLIFYCIYVGHACQKLTASEAFLLFSLECHSDLNTFDHPELGSEKTKPSRRKSETKTRSVNIVIVSLGNLL